MELTKKDVLNSLAFRDFCRGYAEKAMGVLLEVAEDDKSAAAARVSAASAILDRSFGRANTVPEDHTKPTKQGVLVKVPTGKDATAVQNLLDELGIDYNPETDEEAVQQVIEEAGIIETDV